MGKGQHPALQRMVFFYNLFPYPARPLFSFPEATGSLSAHGGFFRLLQSATPSDLAKARDIWTACKQRRRTPLLRQVTADFQKIFGPEQTILLAGSGTDEPLLFRFLHPHQSITAVDLSSASLRRARLRLVLARLLLKFRTGNGKIRFIQGDVASILEKERQKFDYIQCFGVLHHQAEPVVMFRALAEALKPAGFLRVMIYSQTGRRLERRIQKRHEEIWKHNPGFGEKWRLRGRVLQLWLWLMAKKLKSFSVADRFRYLGFSGRAIADAFLHPSDPGLSPRWLQAQAQAYGLKIIFCEAKIVDRGWVCGLGRDDCARVWEEICNAEDNNLLLSNILVTFAS